MSRAFDLSWELRLINSDGQLANQAALKYSGKVEFPSRLFL
jgi:hypothetical protein